MPDPKFTKPWHGIPRDAINWRPTVHEDACIGCGTCVTGCSRLVYRFDYEHKKSVVVDPLNCMVGCTTCANTCPTHAISFPPIETVLALEQREMVRHSIEDELLARRNVLASAVSVPHPDRIITLTVAAIEHVGSDVLRLWLKPVVAGECFCEIIPGQYLELWQPQSQYFSRAYSVANTPDGDGSVELHLRKVEGGRFTAWAFSAIKVGDEVKARGPLGQFTLRSLPAAPLLFIAGGTGLAPVLALLRQQVRHDAQRDMVLLWGAKRAADLYALDELLPILEKAPRLRVVLVAEEGTPTWPPHEHLSFATGGVLDVVKRETSLAKERDIYAAGSPSMLRSLGLQLDRWNVDRDRVHFDSFSV